AIEAPGKGYVFQGQGQPSTPSTFINASKDIELPVLQKQKWKKQPHFSTSAESVPLQNPTITFLALSVPQRNVQSTAKGRTNARILDT
ncbi:hypothetical protein, partial [Pseudomonas syringae]